MQTENQNNMPFLGINMSIKERRIHAFLMWCVTITTVTIDLYNHYVKDNYDINGWVFYPPIIISYFLLYETLQWNIAKKALFKSGLKNNKLVFKAICFNMLTYMVMAFSALFFALIIYGSFFAL